MLPSASDYSTAVQNPRTAFTRDDLRQCQVVKNGLGLPVPYSGGFATAFHLRSENAENHAVRCFIKTVPDLRRRYGALARRMRDADIPWLVAAEYLEGGIRVREQVHPIIRMDWVEGPTLGQWAEEACSDRRRIRGMIHALGTMAGNLERAGLAHGDIHPGNVLVDGTDQPRLIDYDGVWLPEIQELHPGQCGHPDCQHPDRITQARYDRVADRFPFLAITLALTGLLSSLRPETLVERYGIDDEHILLREADFAAPEESRLLTDLERVLPRSQVDTFRRACAGPYDEVPDLSAFPTKRSSRRSYIDAKDLGAIQCSVGSDATIRGEVCSLRHGTTKFNSPYVFLNLGAAYPKHTITVVVWSHGLRALERSGVDPDALIGATVEIQGEVKEYGGRPQISLERREQLRVLGSGSPATIGGANDTQVRAKLWGNPG